MIGDVLKPAEATVYIENLRVRPEDLGSAVTFVYPHGERQHGYISSFGRHEGSLFVRFSGPNGERCTGEQLKWGHV